MTSPSSTPDPGLYIILRIANVDTFQRRLTGRWRDTANIAEGAPGPPPTPEVVTAAVQAGVKEYARIGERKIEKDDLGHGSVGPRQVEADAIASGHIKENAVPGDKIPTDAIVRRHVAAGQISESEIAGRAVGEPELAQSVLDKLNSRGGGESGDESSGEIPDDSILPVKIRAGTDAERKAWRERLEVPHVDILSNQLPPVDGFTVGRDVVILARQSADTRVGFRDTSDLGTELTVSRAGDVFLLQAVGWTRVGNINEGSPVLRARIAAIEAKTDRLTVFGQAVLNPPGIPGPEFPEFIALHLAGKIDPRPLAQIQVNIEGSPVATINQANLILPFNRDGSGIVNLNLVEATRDNLETNLQGGTQFVTVYIRYKFEGTSLAGGTEPDEIDSIRFGVQNNSYRFAFDLRGHASAAATPVAADRFFFTDENQEGDPIRYVQFRNLVEALGIKTRVRAAVGASPAVLPEGTEKVEGWMKKANFNKRHTFSFDLADIPAAATPMSVASRNPNGPDNDNQDITLTMAYVPATRTLTYSIVPSNQGGQPSIGAMRAIGFV